MESDCVRYERWVDLTFLGPFSMFPTLYRWSWPNSKWFGHRDTRLSRVAVVVVVPDLLPPCVEVLHVHTIVRKHTAKTCVALTPECIFFSSNDAHDSRSLSSRNPLRTTKSDEFQFLYCFFLCQRGTQERRYFRAPHEFDEMLRAMITYDW